MIKRIKDPARILTFDTGGANRKKGTGMADPGALVGFDLIIQDGLVGDLIPTGSVLNSPHKVIDAKGKLVIPGIVECHTHALHAGDRSAEFKMKLEGRSYDEIAAAGGGIVSTVKAIRSTNEKELLEVLLKRVDIFISQGVTTLEIKSGYGLDYESELKMLRVINAVTKFRRINIIPTFLGAHTVPTEFKSDRDKYLELLTGYLIPAISSQNLARRCDAFCESSAFSPSEVERVFKKALDSGFELTLHTEQFNNIGGLELALKMGALSVDHLEVLKDEQVAPLASSGTVAVLLPGVSWTLDYNYAPARRLIDAGATVALATDYNPGTSNINSIYLILAMAARKMKMSAPEVLAAYTINAAAALGISPKTGSIEKGKKADIAILDAEHEDQIIYRTGQNSNFTTIVGGKIVYNKLN